MAELALDDDERHALARELDGMGVPELVGRKAPPDAAPVAVLRKSARTAALDQCRPRVGRVMTQNSGPTGSSSQSSSQGCSSCQP